MNKRAYAIQLVAGLLVLTAGGSIGVASARHLHNASPRYQSHVETQHGHHVPGTTTTTTVVKRVVTTTTEPAPTTTEAPTTTTEAPTTVPPTTSTVPPAPPAPVPGVTCTSTISAPASISAAESAAAPGDVVCLRCGVYNQIVNLSHSGTAGAPITVTSAPGETAVLDGAGQSLGSSSGIVSMSGSYVRLSDVELRNSSGRGVSVTGTGDVVSGSKFHDMKFNGLIAAGANEVIEGNEVWNTVTSNVNGAKGSSGWAEAMNTWQATNATFRNNYIHDNWGEGIDFISSKGGVASGNTVVNNYSVLIYIDGSDNISITGNHLSTTNSTFYRGSNPPVGVLMANEGGGGISNITITGNVLTHTGGISSWNVTPTNLLMSGNIIS